MIPVMSHTSSRNIVQVVISGPLRKLFDYRMPETRDNYHVGCRVLIPFGPKQRVGIIIAFAAQSEVPQSKLKTVKRLIDTVPVLTEAQLTLARWSAKYYHHSLGDICFSMLPTKLRTQTVFAMPEITLWHLHDQADGVQVSPQAKKQQECIELLKANPAGVAYEHMKQAGIEQRVLNRLKQLKLIYDTQIIASEKPELTEFQPGPELTSEQSDAVASVSHAQFQAYLLHGVTGSGKTEVYIQIVKQMLEQGKQALILVPEIGLTPQTIKRFQSRIPFPIRVLHSGLNDTEQMTMWSLASLDMPQVVIATRSGLFVSLPKLGIIIVDEEHDSSFKQSAGWRYSARDLAVVRAKQLNIPVVLGSATPSLESLNQVTSKQYQLLSMRQRPEQHTEPRYELLDIRKLPLEQGLSLPLLDRMKTVLARGEQVLVFLNRRGFSPVLMCHECGWLADCQRCDSQYTVHQKQQRLRCHHCDSHRPIPTTCPSCHSHSLTYVGQGTERIEETLRRHFPEVSMARIDRDTTRNKGAMSQYVSDIKNNKYQLLIGTQMLAKGHHFPNLSMVAIVDMDGALYCADFRATERFGQLLMQVSGRAGRADKQGHIVIQTRQPDHPLIQSLLYTSYDAFSQQLLSERQQTHWPPYVHLALINAEAVKSSAPHEFLNAVRQHLLDQEPKLVVLGPVPALHSKRAGKYRFQLLMQSKHRAALHNCLDRVINLIESEKLAKTVRWSLDVDPQDLV